MSVYTSIQKEDLSAWLQHYNIGELIELKGIAQGVTNTNYFVTTTQDRYVLTIFEVLQLSEVPYYLNLKQHLSSNGVACPTPIEDKEGQLCRLLAGKPACLVSCLTGVDINYANKTQCFNIGQMLAKMHTVSQTFPEHTNNPRGLAWFKNTAEHLTSSLTPAEVDLIDNTLKNISSVHWDQLPSGVIHADLFKDNVLMMQDDIAGFIDFYYACNDVLAYDLAITLNDWARGADDKIDDSLALSLIQGYSSIRTLSKAEKNAWPQLLKAAALRFYLSRLLDLHFPQTGDLTYTKDPNAFKQLLEQHNERSDFWFK